MNVRVQQIELELRDLHVDKDMYDLWKNNEVTRKFLLMIEKDYIDECEKVLIGDTIEKIAINEIKRSANCTVLLNVLEWAPDF